MTRVRIGIAGWDYPDWIGPVYPAAARGGVDRLAFVARYVDLVEVNSTFYRPVAARVAVSWVRRTAARGESFAFSAKAHRSWSHEVGPPGAETIAATLDGLRPIREAGKLVALLVQFPQSFRPDDRALARLERLRAATGDWPLAIEVRHADWQRDETAEWFGRSGLAWCVVDQPRMDGSTADGRARVTAPVGYLRLHGRNEQNWFRADAGRDARYDYRYSRTEIAEVAGRVRQMESRCDELVVVQNNHFRGQALANALELKELIERRKPLAPRTLVDAFPDLAARVRVEASGRLF
ncbi:MAG TPA: DUF72 domain-containing protein [Candidatus Polarisedimenticolaceae bacterium]|nr:DUF72 domain-containing protein [Candidatus Polarisedimenticolaceae bacterium]